MDDVVISRFRKKIKNIGRNEKIEIISQSDAKNISTLLKRIEEGGTIFVVKNERTFDMISQKIGEHDYPNVFLQDELVLCPMENNMVPHHIVISKDHIISKLKYHRDYQLPRILFSDSIVRWNGWKCGSYIEISREDGTKYYRHLYCSNRCNVPF